MSHPVRAGGAEPSGARPPWCARDGTRMTFARGVYQCHHGHGKVVRRALTKNELVYSCVCHGERVVEDDVRLLCACDNEAIASTTHPGR
jgi:hypothetical protein